MNIYILIDADLGYGCTMLHCFKEGSIKKMVCFGLNCFSCPDLKRFVNFAACKMLIIYM